MLASSSCTHRETRPSGSSDPARRRRRGPRPHQARTLPRRTDDVRHICLQAQNGTLRFTVSDDGTGYDARHTPMGSGQRNMADRLAALGGRLEVRSAPSQCPVANQPAPPHPGKRRGTLPAANPQDKRVTISTADPWTNHTIKQSRTAVSSDRPCTWSYRSARSGATRAVGLATRLPRISADISRQAASSAEYRT